MACGQWYYIPSAETSTVNGIKEKIAIITRKEDINWIRHILCEKDFMRKAIEEKSEEDK